MFDQDLFAETSWQVLGLNTWQLVRAGSVAGSAVGGAIDLSLGGTSFLTGTLIGGLLGGASSYFRGKRLAPVRVLGQPVGGRLARVGPIRDENFPWILLDRALLHYRSVIGRPHARRDTLVLENQAERGGASGPASTLDASTRSSLAKTFSQLRRCADSAPRPLRDRLEDELHGVLVQVGSDEPAAVSHG